MREKNIEVIRYDWAEREHWPLGHLVGGSQQRKEGGQSLELRRPLPQGPALIVRLLT